VYLSILVATDGSPTAGEAVKQAIELAGAFGAALHIVNVYKAGSGRTLRVQGMSMAVPDGVDPGSVAETQTESVAAQARAKGIAATGHVVSGDPGEKIVAVAEEQAVDLIVVGNKGMKGAKRVLGSVPNKVAHHAPCAVLIVNTT
jgi:nucleotide-binding universal stress UspA family protein